MYLVGGQLVLVDLCMPLILVHISVRRRDWRLLVLSSTWDNAINMSCPK